MSDASSPELVTACLIIIGNEILSGRTQDKNLAFTAETLNKNGIQLHEVRVIPDIEDKIVATVNEMRSQFDYVFTSGGIGPTHDDITTASVAKAFSLPVIMHPVAEKILLEYYGDSATPERMKMATTPEGASLIDNPISKAPGFQMENVYVLPGVPTILQVMLEGLLPHLKGGKAVLSRSVTTDLKEGDIAKALGHLQERYPEVDLGSYPFFKNGKVGTSIVARAMDEARLDRAVQDVKAMMLAQGGAGVEEQTLNDHRSEM